MESHSGPLSPWTIRRIVAATCTICVAGMIVTAALKHIGGVITFGCLSTAGIVTLMAVIATQRSAQPGATWSASVDAGQAGLVESLVSETVAEGANETTVRSLVGAAVELGRSSTRSA